MRQIADIFQTPLPGVDITPRYNVSPGQFVPAVRGANQREIVQLRWSLIPSWSKDAKIAFSCLNARADTVKMKPAFRSAYKSRRCLIPADGYYEWLRQGKDKLPYLYEFDGGKLFSLAGLWESWKDPAVAGAEPLQTFTLIFTDANELASETERSLPLSINAVSFDSES